MTPRFLALALATAVVAFAVTRIATRATPHDRDSAQRAKPVAAVGGPTEPQLRTPIRRLVVAQQRPPSLPRSPNYQLLVDYPDGGSRILAAAQEALGSAFVQALERGDKTPVDCVRRVPWPDTFTIRIAVDLSSNARELQLRGIRFDYVVDGPALTGPVLECLRRAIPDRLTVPAAEGAAFLDAYAGTAYLDFLMPKPAESGAQGSTD